MRLSSAVRITHRILTKFKTSHLRKLDCKVIDLKKSILNGALGANPKNGTFKDFLMHYKIGDQSKDALNKIQLRLYYYKTKAQIPDSIINLLNAKKGQVLLEDDEDPEADDLTIPTALISSTTSKTARCR